MSTIVFLFQAFVQELKPDIAQAFVQELSLTLHLATTNNREVRNMHGQRTFQAMEEVSKMWPMGQVIAVFEEQN